MHKLVYFVLPVLILILSDLLGTIITNKYQIINLKFNTILGFIILLASYYVVVFVPVCFDVKFKTLLIISIIYFLTIFAFIIKNFKQYYSFPSTDKYFILMLILVALQLLFLSFNSIGRLMQYDTVTYGNLITGTIYGKTINYLDYSNGYFGGIDPGYSFQGYYKLASVLYYLANGICNKLGIEFFYFTQHTWMYSIILYFLFSQTIVNLIDYFEIKRFPQLALIILFFVLFMGNFYWNSEQAYLGNSFRMLFASYSLLYLREFLKTKNLKYLILICIVNYAQCSCACSNSTLVIIFMFYVYVFFCETRKEINLVVLSCFLPCLNMFFYIFGYSLKTFIFSIVCFIILFVVSQLFNHPLNKQLKYKYFLPIIVFVIMFILSLNITHNIFDFSAFTNNWSGWQDMTWDYTDFSSLYRVIANLIYVFLIVLLFVVKRNDQIIKMLIFIVLLFFNPLVMAVQEKYMVVFYRNYDIVINYFSLIMAIKTLDNININRTLKNITLYILCILSLYIGIKEFLYHPNGGFEIKDKYNRILRMDQDQADAISYLKYYFASNNINDAKVISSIYQLRCELPFIKTLYSRNKIFNKIESEKELYKMFYPPPDYYGNNYQGKDLDWKHLDDYIKKASYNLIVYDKREIAYVDNDKYISLIELLINCKYKIIYENDTIAIFDTSY